MGTSASRMLLMATLLLAALFQVHAVSASNFVDVHSSSGCNSIGGAWNGGNNASGFPSCTFSSFLVIGPGYGLEFDGVTLNITISGGIENSGWVTTYAGLANSGVVVNRAGGTFDFITSEPSENLHGGMFFNAGNITGTDGTLSNSGTVENELGGTIALVRITNRGDFNNVGSLTPWFEFDNYGALFNSGTIVLASAALLFNSGSIHNNGTIRNERVPSATDPCGIWLTNESNSTYTGSPLQLACPSNQILGVPAETFFAAVGGLSLAVLIVAAFEYRNPQKRKKTPEGDERTRLNSRST